jgi:hypothetical protein
VNSCESKQRQGFRHAQADGLRRPSDNGKKPPSRFRLVYPNLNGPLKIRSAGPQPGTARSAAQASEADRMTATPINSGV